MTPGPPVDLGELGEVLERRRRSRRRALPESSLPTCCDRRGEARPRRGRPPSRARSARTRRARRRRSRRRRGARRRRGCTAPTPKISWISRSAGPRPASGPTRHRPSSPSSPIGHLLVALRRHGRRCWHIARRVRTLAACASSDFDYDLPRGAHRPGADRAPRRGPPARRPGERAARAPHGRRPARPAARRRRRRRQRDQGDPGPPAPAPGDRRRGRGAAARAARRRPAARGRRSCARPASCAPGEELLAADGRPVARRSARAPRPATRSRVELLGDGDPLDAARPSTARCRCRRTSRRRLDRPRPLPDRLRRPSPARRPRRPPACTSRPSCSTRIAAPRRRPSRRSSWSSGSTRSSRSASDDPLDHRMHSERYRVPRGDVGGVPRARSASSPSARRACGRSSRPPRPASSRAAPSCSSTAAYDVAGRRRAADQLPPAAHDAADDDRRLRRRPLARAVRRRRWPSGYRFLSLRRRHAPRPARPVASPRLHPVRIELEAADGAARAGVAHDGPRARTARRASCRSAPAARSSTSAPPTTSALGAEIVLGNTYHLMLRPGADDGRPLRRPRPVRRLGRADAHRLAAASRCSRSSPKVDDDGVTFRSTYDGSTHRFTPGVGGRRRRSCSAPTSRWCSTCARRCRARPTSIALGRRAHGGVGRAGPRRPPPRRPGAVRHRAGRHRRGAAGRERRSAPSTLDFDGYGIGGLSVGETRGRDAAGARRGARPTCPPTGRAT